ncbi:S-adenosylmethionine-dependent methyltransferase [Psychromonas marina]|uniref:S-adenosylmethionine-dependent methyltransferase n=1 Tax=Psychromonas marina TaxID=88364 RepID=A0ABQ6E4T9_9GAMM|nr:class I SAM-dependent methyltransferase [Psychromonas marina]GLS92397.1 S-adenosylmethionine-dependent methyltransferase [Psychromonas marina]
MTSYFDSVAKEWDKSALKVERAKVTADKIKTISFHCTNSCIDFGSGTGLLGLQLIDTFANIHLVDASNEMLSVARHKIDNGRINNVETHCANSLCVFSEQHSAIVMMLVLHHIVNIESFFVEAYERLAPKGKLMIADLYEEDGSFHKHNVAFSGHDGFNISELTILVERSGFKVEKVEHYYDIWKENFAGNKVAYPLFLMVVQKL